tara:strand:- start:784 stop:1110 length:327 start_codon:yes stop_codon:yes gene_type:complete
MSDIFDNFSKIFKKDLVPILVKYFKDPNNKITDNLNEFLQDPQTLLTDIYEKFLRNKNIVNNQTNYSDSENMNTIDIVVDDEYDELLQRLNLIQENMIQIEKILKDKN